jgi:hypothetical protein
MKKIFFLSLTLIFFFLSCKKKEMETVNSKNYFILKNNGKFISFPDTHITDNGTINVIGTGSTFLKTGFCMLPIRKDLSPGTYEYENTNNTPFSFTYFVNQQLAYVINKGSIKVVTNDTVSRKMELRFEIELYDSNTHLDTIQITEGHTVVNY